MSSTFRLLTLLVFGCLAVPALADEAASDPQSLPCNALCRRWMGFAEEVAPAPQPPAIDRQTLDVPAPVAARPAPVATRRPESKPAVPRQAQTAALPLPPVKLRRDQRVPDGRRVPAISAASHGGPRLADATVPRRPAAGTAALVVAGVEPMVAPPRPAAPSSSAARTAEAATHLPATAPARVAEPARPVERIDFVLPLLEQPPPPVIALPAPSRRDALPPAFDVIAAVLLAAPPRH